MVTEHTDCMLIIKECFIYHFSVTTTITTTTTLFTLYIHEKKDNKIAYFGRNSFFVWFIYCCQFSNLCGLIENYIGPYKNKYWEIPVTQLFIFLGQVLCFIILVGLNEDRRWKSGEHATSSYLPNWKRCWSN